MKTECIRLTLQWVRERLEDSMEQPFSRGQTKLDAQRLEWLNLATAEVEAIDRVRAVAPCDAPVVILESPFAGAVDRNIAYAQAALRDCLLRGEAPFASHLLYTQPGVLRDHVPSERDHGIQAGFAFRKFATKTVAYVDLGYSHGMKLGIEHARKLGQPVEVRTLQGWGPKDIPRVDLPLDGCGR